jgi:hypothetical protein
MHILLGEFSFSLTQVMARREDRVDPVVDRVEQGMLWKIWVVRGRLPS